MNENGFFASLSQLVANIIYFAERPAECGFQLALVDNREVLPVRHGPLMAPPAGMRMVVTSERPTNTLSLSLTKG